MSNIPKRPIEGSIVSCFSYMALTNQAGLGGIPEEIAKDLHLYAVCQRPRIALSPEEFVVGDHRCHVVFTAQHGDSKRRIEFDAPNYLGRADVVMESAWPYTDFEIRGASGGDRLVWGQASLFLSKLGYHDENLDLEVMYIGQAYGEAGARNAVQRLRNHSTLQAIYAEAVRRAPDRDIFLVLFGLDDPYGLITFAPVEGDVAEITARFQELRTPVSDQQYLNFTEAALIRYFKPQYNKEYKDTFPSPAHRTYSECYDLDLNVVAFEMDTGETLGTRLYSAAVPRGWTHTPSFFLHNRTERRHMFDFSPA